MADIEFRVSLHPNQRTIFDSNSRYKVIAAGRRFGKTWLSAYEILLKHAFQVPDGVTWIVSPRYSQTMLMWKRVKGILPRELIAETKEGERYIKLHNGHYIYAKSGDDPDALRGEGLDFVVIDEAAMIKPDVWFEALAPALMDRRGGAMLISTPKGLNHFYDLYQRGESEDYPEWESFHYTSFDNPYLSETEIKELAKDLPPQVYRQEIMAEFLEGVGEVFGEINWIEPTQLSEIPPLDPHSFYIAGLDLASVEDYTVHTIMRYTDTGGKIVLEELFRDRFSGVWESQLQRIARNQMMFGNPQCYTDVTGLGQPIVQRLRNEGIFATPVSINATSKSEIINNLSFIIEAGVLKLIRTKEAVDEFTKYSYSLTNTGFVKYSAPKGYHDDIVMAVALAAWGIRISVPTIGAIGRITEVAKETFYDEERIVDYDELRVDQSYWDE
jgi:hypothetical protein